MIEELLSRDDDASFGALCHISVPTCRYVVDRKAIMSGSNAQSQRDASDVGIPCSICSSIDFLPFKCVYCQRVFCKEHSSQARPEEHACPVYSGSSNIVSNDGEQNRVVSGSFKDLLPGKANKKYIYTDGDGIMFPKDEGV